jgi:hypothetical protein
MLNCKLWHVKILYLYNNRSGKLLQNYDEKTGLASRALATRGYIIGLQRGGKRAGRF